MRPKEPSFTFGIEEEYHLVDLKTRGFAAAPAALMEACEAALGKQVAPEFFRSQIEIGTSVCRDFANARKELAHLRRTIADTAREFGLAPIAASTHPFADKSHARDDTQGALPGARPRLRRHRPAARHLRHARARRHRGRRAAHRPDEPGALLPAASADAVDLLAVLAGRGHRPQELPARRLPRAAAHRPAAALRKLRRVPAHRRRAGQERRHRGCHQDLVGLAPLGPLSHARDARHRRVHAHRRRAVDRRALRLHPAHALPAAPLQPEVALLPGLSHRGEPLARPALRRAATGCSISARASSCRSRR